MAIRTRLSAPREEQTNWRWHKASWMTIASSALRTGDRRMEAENYLSSGYGIRLAISAQKIAPASIGSLADVWQPSRLKGIQVDREFGVSFLAATQVFDLRPRPRKFLSLDRTDNSEGRFIENGTIVITCSGSVGRATLIYEAHRGVLISHDLLRVIPKEPNHWGWLYAYFRSRSAFQMMTSAKYGHMIKHLEPSHLQALPIPVPRDDILESFQRDAKKILNWRNCYWKLQCEAEAIFSECVGKFPPGEQTAEIGFEVSARAIFGKRRRFEASCYSPIATNIIDQFKKAGLHCDSLRKVTKRVWWPNRFKRVFGDEGDRYLSADELFSINPVTSKRVIVEQAADVSSYRVKEGWIVMARSGQVYGLNGSVALLTKQHEAAFFSEDLIRIVADEDQIRPGYLFTALGHPELGRPLVIRHAYGTSIPHLDPEDVMEIPIVRLGVELEAKIADLMEQAMDLRVRADHLEDDLADRAEALTAQFLEGDLTPFNVKST